MDDLSSHVFRDTFGDAGVLDARRAVVPADRSHRDKGKEVALAESVGLASLRPTSHDLKGTPGTRHARLPLATMAQARRDDHQLQGTDDPRVTAMRLGFA